ncbi:uncharacterized protein [Henckelia pumila]|uniref:uncharacterized protein n=1 Tax=Henckelia pumila TaxID=405737 RepID=UPI003C6E6407
MPENLITVNEMEEEDEDAATTAKASECAAVSRTERRKAAKKEKRKKKRTETAVIARQEVAARLNDPDEQLRLQAVEELEKKRAENERREFEERERMIQEAWARKRAIEEEKEEMRRKDLEEQQSRLNEVGYENEVDDDEYEYVEEGPPEIIWQGNEIIVKKKKVRVKKKDPDHLIAKEDPNRPTSNPLPPQSEAFADYKSASIPSAQQLLESFAQQTPNFGTEQDKAHCPFHLKTGACRFGSRCSRIHFYPDKSCTFLIKNMYNGPGLAWEQDEGLEYTDEEVDRAYEEFYEDVHTEFLKFGEIVNFKVCRNGSSHLRGNVYVHYKNLDSAELAYYSVNGRYFGGKQLHCEFVGVMKWKVAICGEYMKSKFTTCSRGIACNFIHCFRNAGGDYEWADWDKPPPRFWVKKMASLFGYSDESVYSKQTQEGSPRFYRDTSKCSADVTERHSSWRSQSKESGYSRSTRNYSESYTQRSTHQQQRRSSDRKQKEFLDEKPSDKLSISRLSHSKNSSSDSESDRDWLDRGFRDKLDGSSRKRSRVHSTEELETQGHRCDGRRTNETISDPNLFDNDRYDYAYRKYAKGTQHRDRRLDILDENPCASSIAELSDEEGHNMTSESGRMNPRQQKLSKAPDDYWDGSSRTYDSDVNNDCSNGERGRYSSHIHNKKSSRSVNCEVFEDDRPQINDPSNLTDSVAWESLGQQDEEVEADNEACRNRAWRCKTSDSNPRNASIKDNGKPGYAKSNKLLNNAKKSKRKRDGDNTQAPDHNGRRSHPTAFSIDENLDNRGRWEPDEVG